MKRDSEISCCCNGFSQFNNSNRPYKKRKVICISETLSCSVKILPSPIILHQRSCSRNTKDKITRRFVSHLKKKSSSSVIEEITRSTFNAAVLKSLVVDRGVSKSSSWVKSQFLGKGSYGSVYLATSKTDESKTIMAIKSAEISRASSLMYEKKLLTRISSPFVVRCYGDEIARENNLIGIGGGGGEVTNYNLILEYCSGKSIADLIKTNGGGLREKDVKEFARDILYGLFCIHRENIIHCDIKPDNILLVPFDTLLRPTGYLTKIADFGLAMEKGSIEYGNGSGHMRGTKRYMAPELISHGIVDYGVDTWAFGCTVLEMLTGKVAWGNHTHLGSKDLVDLTGVSEFFPFIPNWLSEEAQDFLSKCLVKDSGSRWGIGELMNHPFVISEVEESHNGFLYD